MPRAAKRCCIKNCSAPITYRNYKFPNDENGRNLWLSATKRYLKKGFDVNKSTICKQHFTEDSFYPATYKIWKDGCEVDFQRKYIQLKKNSVPSIFEDNGDDSETESLEKSENVENPHLEDFKTVYMKYTFGNSLDSDNSNEKLISNNETEATDLNSLDDDDIKKSRIKKKQQTRLNKVKIENSAVPISKFPEFTFADSFKDDSENIDVKRRKISPKISINDCEKIKEVDEQLKILDASPNVKNENPSLHSPNVKSENFSLHSEIDINEKSTFETNKSTNSETNFPSFTFANSDTGNRELSIPKNNEITKPTINNVVQIRTGTNQLQSLIPVSDLSNYTFATRPKPSSPNCTEVLILKRLNKIATFSTVPNLNSANKGIINNSIGNLALCGGSNIRISEVHSESPEIFQPGVHFTKGSAVTNEKSTSKCLQLSSQRVKKKKNERDLSPSSLRRVNIVNDLIALNSSHPVNESISSCTSTQIENNSSVNSTIEYSKSTLMWDWNYRKINEFPKYWGMIDSPEGVFFGYVGDVPNCITRSIYIKDDMNVELRAYNRSAKYPVIEKIMNLENLRIAMIKIVSMDLCINSVEGKCENGFYIRKNRTTSRKCKDCQIKIYKEQKCIKRKNRRLIEKKERRTKNLKNIRQKLTRALSKIEIMQKAYEELSSTLLQNE